ncbi:hypothetical protein RclHR1_22950001 [Rhizophagus clarus]|nr:hypothetical protein RclHR1_22950001 [Rhizophagus clarus]
MTVPILWKDPTKKYDPITGNACKILFNVILLHLSDESRNNLKNQEIDLFAKTHQRLLFNYINFWMHLDLCFLERAMHIYEMENSKISILTDEILKLLINNDKKFKSLSIPGSFNSYLFSRVEHCFSDLQYFYCDCNININILKGLTIMSTSIEKLELKIEYKSATDPSRIIELIEAQKNLKEVNLTCKGTVINDDPYHKAIEESLIKCADTIQYLRINWEPITKFLSHLVNLVSLDLRYLFYNDINWDYTISLPHLKFLYVKHISSGVLANIIENTNGYLSEIILDYYHGDDGGRHIRAIYQHCSNLNYLKLSLQNKDVLEFQNLLIICKLLSGLEVTGMDKFNWSELLKIMTKSPINLFKLKFINPIFDFDDIRTLKLFLDNCKNRHPISLQIISTKLWKWQIQLQQLVHLLTEYKAKGIIKDFEYIERNLFC